MCLKRDKSNMSHKTTTSNTWTNIYDAVGATSTL